MKSLLKHSTASAALLLLFVALCGLSATAQETAPANPPKPQRDIIIERNGVVEHNGVVITTDADGPVRAALPPMAPMAPLPPSGDGYTFNFVTSEMSFDRKVVKGAPYSADALTETVQTLGDGNRIVRKSSAKVYRDSEGRTRRDQTLSAIGPFATSGDAPQMSSINDPVSGFSYTLDQRTHTARKLLIRNLSAPPNGVWKVEGKADGPAAAAAAAAGKAPGAPVVQEHQRVMIIGGGGGGEAANDFKVRVGGPAGKEMPKPVTESLGKQTVEGVLAEGTRTTFTIPAGEIGNERPIQIVNERWYSPELQTVVMTKRTDPLAGETTYKLTNINRSEPDHSLFEVPADYKVKEGAQVFEFRYNGDKKPGENR